jgi:hypothetical protein
VFRDFDTAFGLFDRALQASPNTAFAWSRSSPVFSYVGDGAEATRRAMQGLRLSPFDPNIFFTHCALGFAAYTLGAPILCGKPRLHGESAVPRGQSGGHRAERRRAPFRANPLPSRTRFPGAAVYRDVCLS